MCDETQALTLGAIVDDSGTTFRVWAPDASEIVLRLDSEGVTRDLELERAGGYATLFVPGVRAGARYRYIVDGRDLPDPCSRNQPHGVHEDSEVVDPRAFRWADEAFVAPEKPDFVFYECHIGTLTEAGTFDAAIGQLERLAALGVNAIELMPVAAFAGARNWGYDSVSLFAPYAGYGGPDGLRRFVDAAHAAGIAVILDVVYNHFGPSGNYTRAYSKEYLTAKHQTPWGDAVNFDSGGSAEVRRFVKENLLHWSREYHIDGFRFDAAHEIRDDSPTHILAEVSAMFAAERRATYLAAESNENDVRYVRPREDGGFGLDAVWADDFHHVVRNIMHSERTAYLGRYRGDIQELARAVTRGWVYEGQADITTGEPIGTDPAGTSAYHFLFAIQNHDQVANRPFALRASASMSYADYLAASGLLLLAPETPLIFQGQEFFATTPFFFFTNHGGELGRSITDGRRREFEFPDGEEAALIADPEDELSFTASKLRIEERLAGAGRLVEGFYGECLALRAEDAVLGDARRRPLDAAVVTFERAMAVRISNASGARYLAVNFGDEARLELDCRDMGVLLHSQETRFGGSGVGPSIEGQTLVLPPHSFAWLSS